MARDLDWLEADVLKDALGVLEDWAAEAQPDEPGVFAAREAALQIRSLLTLRTKDGART